MNGGLGVAWMLGFFVTVGAVVFGIGYIRHLIGQFLKKVANVQSQITAPARRRG
jgi:glycerol-3-phosphate acyltransferase PlsY